MATTVPTLRELAVRYLRERIGSGALPPGARLSDLILAKEIGISRTPVREAIQQLAADGLVQVVPHQGATVREPDLAELEELYEIREALESHAAARAAALRQSEQAEELLAICAAMEAIPCPFGEQLDEAGAQRQRELDLAFHHRILALSGLRRLQRLVEDAGVIARPFEVQRVRMSGDLLAEVCRHHRAIAAAIAAGDAAGARVAMQTHIVAGRTEVREQLAHWRAVRAATLPAALRPFA